MARARTSKGHQTAVGGSRAPGGISAQVWRSSRLLADGREIIYYDEAPGTGRADVPDSRDLPPRDAPDPDALEPDALEPDALEAGAPDRGTVAGSASELRFDPLLGEWVIFAAQRQKRTFLPSADHCPLCPSRPGRFTEIPAPSYDVVVFENRFPALSGATPQVPTAGPGQAGSRSAGSGPAGSGSAGSGSAGSGSAGSGPAGSGWAGSGSFGARLPGFGRCEMICFTEDHDVPFAGLSTRRARTVMEAWADRTRVLGAVPGIEHVYCFENAGEEVGATLSHPHGQIYALPFVPPRTQRLVASAHAHRARHGRNLFDDLVASEVADGRRIVVRNDHWVAFVHVAAHWPYEVMLFPAARVADITELADPARAAFCDIYLDILRRFDALFGAPMPHVAAWQQAAVHDQADRAEFAAHMQVLGVLRAVGRRKFLAGTEVGAQVWSNDVLPENAALALREAGR